MPAYLDKEMEIVLRLFYLITFCRVLNEAISPLVH